MMNRIFELFNQSSEALKNAMEQYIRYIGILSSIRNIEIESDYQQRLSQDTMITNFEIINKHARRMSLLLEKESTAQNIVLQTHKSLLLALQLVDFSINTNNKLGIGMAGTLINTILKFTTDNKSTIDISMNMLSHQIITIYDNLLRSDFKNADLINALNQLRTI